MQSKEKQKEYYQINKKKIINKQKAYYQINKEKIRQREKERYQKNKEKMIERQKKYYRLNREEVLKKSSQYYRNNIDKKKEYSHQYDKNNRDKRNDYRKNKYDNDPIYRLRTNMTNAVNQSLKKSGLSKGGTHWEKLVGYTKKELKKHLENLFKPGMSWKNREEWHIDHIIPVSFFKYNSTDDVEFRYCWSLNNIQPLWAIDNLEKGDKITFYDQDR